MLTHRCVYGLAVINRHLFYRERSIKNMISISESKQIYTYMRVCVFELTQLFSSDLYIFIGARDRCFMLICKLTDNIYVTLHFLFEFLGQVVTIIYPIFIRTIVFNFIVIITKFLALCTRDFFMCISMLSICDLYRYMSSFERKIIGRAFTRIILQKQTIYSPEV